MYYPYFISYILIGFLLSVAVLAWALKNGQFKEQQRARFLPLEADGKVVAAGSSRWSRIEIYGLMFLACAGLLPVGRLVPLSRDDEHLNRGHPPCACLICSAFSTLCCIYSRP
jgi:hypothetical protein